MHNVKLVMEYYNGRDMNGGGSPAELGTTAGQHPRRLIQLPFLQVCRVAHTCLCSHSNRSMLRPPGSFVAVDRGEHGRILWLRLVGAAGPRHRRPKR